MARADIIATNVNNNAVHFNGGGVNYVVQKHGTPATFYIVYVDQAVDIVYIKSTDGGFTWSHPVTVFTGTAVALSVWYQRWSNISGDIVHIAYIESGGANVLYRSLDISSDTLGTETTVFDGASTAGGGALTICETRGGHIRVVYNIDNGTEDGTASSTDAGATWGDTIADATEGATQDQFFLLPGWNADTQDTMLIFVDASANGLSVKRYDDSGNSWAESAIIADGSFVEQAAGTAFPHLACFVDISNSRNVIIAWSAVDTANADLRCFIIDDTTITETATNVVLNSTDDQGLCAFGLDTGTNTWYAFYGGKSDGTETYPTAMKIYYKTSTDAGATWGSETVLTLITRSTSWIACTPRFSTDYLLALTSDLSSDQIIVSANLPSGAAGGSPIFGGAIVR